MTLYTISAPELNSSEYGSNIAEVFNNINENFKMLANSNYSKGASGLTVSLEVVSLDTYLENIAEAIYTYASEELGSDITQDDIENQLSTYFSSSSLYMFKIYAADTDEYEYVSSLPFWFIDTNRTSGDETYVDLSCAVVYQDSSWKVLNIFPTIYYNTSSESLCWKLNGQETGISIYSSTSTTTTDTDTTDDDTDSDDMILNTTYEEIDIDTDTSDIIIADEDDIISIT